MTNAYQESPLKLNHSNNPLPTIVTVYYLLNHQQTASPADQVIVESLEILLQQRFETASPLN